MCGRRRTADGSGKFSPATETHGRLKCHPLQAARDSRRRSQARRGLYSGRRSRTDGVTVRQDARWPHHRPLHRRRCDQPHKTLAPSFTRSSGAVSAHALGFVRLRYYQPEAYIPQARLYIEKDARATTTSTASSLGPPTSSAGRRAVVASVSDRPGLPECTNSVLPIRKGVETDRDEMLRKLIDLQYSRNDIDFKRGTFRVRGDVVELHPSYEEFAYRIEFFGDEITTIDAINPLTGELLASHDQIFIYPAVHYVMPEDKVQTAVQAIRDECTSVISCAARVAAEAQRRWRGRNTHRALLEVGSAGDRELQPPPRRPQAGGEAVHADRLLPEGFPAHHRREPRHAPADQGDVQRRPSAQGGPR